MRGVRLSGIEGGWFKDERVMRLGDFWDSRIYEDFLIWEWEIMIALVEMIVSQRLIYKLLGPWDLRI